MEEACGTTQEVMAWEARRDLPRGIRDGPRACLETRLEGPSWMEAKGGYGHAPLSHSGPRKPFLGQIRKCPYDVRIW